MKRVIRFLVGWVIPVLLVLPTAGCFTACSRFMGNRPSTTETIVCGALDVATLPVQIVVIGPLALGECIDANTGERGRLKRRRKDIERIKGELTADFSRVYSDREFLSPTNTLQREALGEWLGHCNCNRPNRELIDPLAERLLNEPEAAYALINILEQKNLSPALKKKLCVSLVEDSRTQAKDRQSRIVNIVFNGNHLSEDELRALVSGKSDSADEVIESK